MITRCYRKYASVIETKEYLFFIKIQLYIMPRIASNSLEITTEDQQGTIKIDFIAVKKARMILRAINHTLRQQIIKLLEEKERLTVTEIYVKLRLEQSVASQHLAILRRAEIVETEREGKYIFYTLNKARIAEVMEFVGQLVD